MDWQEAANRLDAAFAGKGAVASVAVSQPLVGVFGNGLPEALLLAAGCTPVDVKSAPEEPRPVSTGISGYIEPFVDDYARLFLNRLFDGAFSRLAAVVFCRDDAAGLVAYQYAREYARQQGIAASIPRLLLWNAVSGTGKAVAAFNRRQAEGLWRSLEGLGGHPPSEDELAAAIRLQGERAEVLEDLEKWRRGPGARLSGTEALRWRNAGRFLPPAEHAALLRAVTASLGRRAPRTGPRIGLIGAGTDAEMLYAALEREGTIVCDPHPFGTVWPGPQPPAGADLDDLLATVAGDPMLQRTKSVEAHRAALVAACMAAQCDVVAAQIDQNDDTFGWEWPALAAALAGEGIATVNLGFRDHRPDQQWYERARVRVAEAAGGGT